MKSRGRGDGHRTHLQGGAAERDPRPGDQAHRPGRHAVPVEGRPRAGPGRAERGAAFPRQRGARPRVDRAARARAHRHRPVVPGEPEGDRGFRGEPFRGNDALCRRASRGQADGLQRRADRLPRGHGRGDGAPGAEAPRCHTGLQAGRHLRGGVRSLDPVLLLDLGDGGRVPPVVPQEGHDPGRRTQPDRPGHRVRLLLRARGIRAAGDGNRDHHGELEPRDRLHGLRHLRHAVRRAAHPRGRARHRGQREARRGHRAAGRTDAPDPRRGPGRGGRPDPRHKPRCHRQGGGQEAVLAARPVPGLASARERHRGHDGRSPRDCPAASATPCSCGPATCWAEGRCRSSSTTPAWTAT